MGYVLIATGNYTSVTELGWMMWKSDTVAT